MVLLIFIDGVLFTLNLKSPYFDFLGSTTFILTHSSAIKFSQRDLEFKGISESRPAIVEPIFAVIGAALVILVWPILPYALSFAAGAMIFIVVEEVIPESQKGGNTDLATMGLIAGFIVMMSLDVALG